MKAAATVIQTTEKKQIACNISCDDAALVRRVKSGDSDAFGQLYDRHHAKVRGLVISMTGRRNIDDLVQECFIHAFRSLQRFREEAAFSTWLHRVTVNTVLSALRKPNRLALMAEPPDPTDEAGQNPEQQSMGQQAVARLYQLLDTMSPKRRAALTLFSIEGRSLKETADLLASPVSVIKSRLFFARRELKQKAGADPVLGPLLEEMSI